MEKQTPRGTATMRATRSLTKATLIAGVALLAGCMGATKESIIPQEGPTMAQVYRSHLAATGMDSTRLARNKLPLREPHEVDVSPFTRTAYNETESRFPRLPNPDLVMYVTPHLAGVGRYPVPGYTTVFPMYESVEYALPGEVRPHEIAPLKPNTYHHAGVPQSPVQSGATVPVSMAR